MTVLEEINYGTSILFTKNWYKLGSSFILHYLKNVRLCSIKSNLGFQLIVGYIKPAILEVEDARKRVTGLRE